MLERLDTAEKQTVDNLVAMLEDKYGRTRLEEVETWIQEWMNFKPGDYQSEEEYLEAMERLYDRKQEKEIEDKEWFAVWMMIQTRNRKGIESHELTQIRDIVKKNEDDVMKEFRNKYRELKIEPNRGKVKEALYMGNQSESRKRFHDKRQRTQSRDRGYYQDKKRREYSQGRGYYRAYSKDRSRFSRNYRNERSQSRDRGNSRDNR